MTTIDLALLDSINGGEPPAPGTAAPTDTGTGRPAGDTTDTSAPLTVDVLRQFCVGLDMQSRRAQQHGDPAVANALDRAANACYGVLPKK
jgi:hypothetical protein